MCLYKELLVSIDTSDGPEESHKLVSFIKNERSFIIQQLCMLKDTINIWVMFNCLARFSHQYVFCSGGYS